MVKKVLLDPLASWANLNEALREADEATTKGLLAREKKDKKRVQYLLRIHARFNKVRAARERAELLAESK